MTINELHILFDINHGNAMNVLEAHASKSIHGYFFVDDEDGHCYLFDENENEKDISIIKEIDETMIRKDIKKIVIPNSVMNIRNWAFSNCNMLKSVTVGDSVTSIWAYAFYKCSRLTNVTILDSVTSIGYDAFYYCRGLTSVTFKDKTLKEVKAMENYPWRIEDESIIKVKFI